MNDRRRSLVAKDEAELLAAAVAGAAFVFGVYQYYVAQKWQRSEFAAKQLELLTSDPDIAFCCMALDYSARRVPVPQSYAVFTGDQYFTHEPNLMVDGIRPEATADEFEWPLIRYRDAFDRFFTYLDQIDHYLSIHLFSLRDVSSLRYWLEQLVAPRFVPSDKKDAFIQFARAYNYTGALHLMERFGLQPRQDLAGNSGHAR